LRKLHRGVSIRELETTTREVTEANGSQLTVHLGHSIGLKVEEHPHLRSVRMSYPDLKIENNMVVVTKSGARALTTYPREPFC